MRHTYRIVKFDKCSFILTSVGIVLSGPTMATSNLSDEKAVLEMGEIQVTGERKDPYRAIKPSSAKYTEPLRDTPQTITVIPQQVIEEQALLTLREVLSTVPGITFGAGEGGGNYGDSVYIRGFSAQSDIYINGVRDSGEYTRSDPFNLERVEVTNGANSVYSGAGSVGGTINLVTKSAHEGNANKISIGLGTDQYQRLTLDTNQQLNDTTGFRLNLMGHRNEVSGRDKENFKRWGVAPSLAFGLGTPTRAVINYVHQEDKNIPQYGLPIYNGKVLNGAHQDNYYGYSNINTQEIEADSLSLNLEHDFSDTMSIRNHTSVAQVQQLSRTSSPEGTYCLSDTGLTPAGEACRTGAGTASNPYVLIAPGYYRPTNGGTQGSTRDTTNKVFTNQTDLTSHFNSGFIEHALVMGMAFSREESESHTGSWMRTQEGGVIVPPDNSISSPNSHWVGPHYFSKTAHITGAVDNRAFYVFDTLKFGPRWEVSGGLRYERNEGDSRNNAINATTGVVTRGQRQENTDDLLSYRAGIVYKPVENASVYVAYGNTKTPSQASVNDSCFRAGRSGVSTNNCNADPEESVTYEVGVKWDVLDNDLSLTAALFRNDRTNYRVASSDPTNLSGEQPLDGKARVDGMTLGMTGSLTPNWHVFANYTYLDSKVLQSVSDYTREQTGIDTAEGAPLTLTPKHAMSLWTTYDLPHDWQVGYGLTTQSRLYLASAHNAPTAPGYTVHRAMLSYRVSPELLLRLNVNNLFDKFYLSRIRNNGWAVPGDGRAAILSMDYEF
ncbi:TonB-dependent siderophore receptor [Pseudomonas sp. L13]|uniref:TonB-dependent receptor n=1 Tax=Pseudomonas sp. L13 TaxID=343985 RepID=UPI001379BEEA|nr:TonB-dependent siderophore receptor [Pseudomonas sp. L13]NCE89694.1 TonB-dependent siderophore receptor [Pseudomonas sp. L13]